MHESEKWKWSRSVVSDSRDPMDCSPPGLSVHGIFQAKVLECGAIAFSINSCRDYLTIHCKLALNQEHYGLFELGNFLKKFFTASQNIWDLSSLKVAQSCPTLCDPMDYTVHGILQARILEWLAVSLLQGIFPTQGSNPGLSHCRLILYQLSHQGSPLVPWNRAQTHTPCIGSMESWPLDHQRSPWTGWFFTDLRCPPPSEPVHTVWGCFSQGHSHFPRWSHALGLLSPFEPDCNLSTERVPL